jgi:PST family polysaccharide transporter
MATAVSLRIKRLRSALAHPISQNVVALGWLQIATFIVPLITIPYVARVLQPATYGLIVLSQSVTLVLIVFIDWGFGYWAVREVAVKRDDPEQLADVAQRVRGAQLLLAAASAPIALTVLALDHELALHPIYLVLAWIAAVATGIAPNWYFLGIERMRLITLIQLGFRFVGAGLTFVLVKGPGQGWVVMALFAAAAVASWIASDVMMYRHVRFRVPRWRASVAAVRGAAPLFVGAVAVTLYTAFNTVLLSFFESSTAVAHFGAAERVVRVAATAGTPIGLAVFPRIVALQAARRHDRARQLLGIAVVAATVLAVVLGGGLALFAPQVVRIIYGRAYVEGTVPLLRVLLLLFPIGLISATAGTWIASLRMDRRLVTIVVGAGLLNVTLGVLLTPRFGPTGMAWSVVTAEAAAAAAVVVTVLRSGHDRTVALFARSSRRTLQ